eukprot:570065_1
MSDVFCLDNVSDWSDIFKRYILPNSGSYRYQFGNWYPTGDYPHWCNKEEMIMNYGYAFYSEFEEDYMYNNNDTSAQGIQNTFKRNFPSVWNAVSVQWYVV